MAGLSTRDTGVKAIALLGGAFLFLGLAAKLVTMIRAGNLVGQLKNNPVLAAAMAFGLAFAAVGILSVLSGLTNKQVTTTTKDYPISSYPVGRVPQIRQTFAKPGRIQLHDVPSSGSGDSGAVTTTRLSLFSKIMYCVLPVFMTAALAFNIYALSCRIRALVQNPVLSGSQIAVFGALCLSTLVSAVVVGMFFKELFSAVSEYSRRVKNVADVNHKSILEPVLQLPSYQGQLVELMEGAAIIGDGSDVADVVHAGAYRAFSQAQPDSPKVFFTSQEQKDGAIRCLTNVADANAKIVVNLLSSVPLASLSSGFGDCLFGQKNAPYPSFAHEQLLTHPVKLAATLTQIPGTEGYNHIAAGSLGSDLIDGVTLSSNADVKTHNSKIESKINPREQSVVDLYVYVPSMLTAVSSAQSIRVEDHIEHSTVGLRLSGSSADIAGQGISVSERVA